jgi:hypothetical protein
MPAPTVTIDVQPQSRLALTGTATLFSVTGHTSDGSALAYQWHKDGVEIAGATSSVLSLAAVIPEDASVYFCSVSCAGGLAVRTDTVVLASSLLDYIELNMKVSILGLTKASGYNFDWLSVNQEDQTIGGYPRALIESPQETSLDDPNGASAGMYTNEVLFIIWVTGQQLIDASPNPNFTIRSNLRLAEDDLKKLFGTNIHVNGTCDDIMFRGALIVKGDKNDVLKPASMQTQWRVRFSQDRQTPTQYAGS